MGRAAPRRASPMSTMDNDKLLYPELAPVRLAAEMSFSEEQLAWLADIARPRCCHTTGEHDPEHFIRRSFVCRDQLADIAWRLRAAVPIECAVVAHSPELRLRPMLQAGDLGLTTEIRSSGHLGHEASRSRRWLGRFPINGTPARRRRPTPPARSYDPSIARIAPGGRRRR